MTDEITKQSKSTDAGAAAAASASTTGAPAAPACEPREIEERFFHCAECTVGSDDEGFAVVRPGHEERIGELGRIGKIGHVGHW